MRRSHCLLAVVLAPGLACAAHAQQRAPSSSEQTKLVNHYLALDGRDIAARREQLAIVERLDSVPVLTTAQVKSWRKKLSRAFARGRQLEPGSGESYWWEKPRKRGRYILGGKTSNPHGLLIAMHGGGAGSGNASSAQGAFDSAAKKLGWLAIYPEVLEKTEHGWTDADTEEWVLDLIAAARRTYKIDPNRIYFCGHSMGGYGTWTLGSRHADLVAGLAPSAGAPTPILDPATGKAVDVVEGVVPCLHNVRVVIYQSDDDPQVPPDANRAAAKSMAAAKERWGGFDFEYWEESGRGHAMPPGGAIALLEKISKHERNPRPQKIVWQPSKTWKRQFYWLFWELPAPDALVVAELDRDANAVRITTDAQARGLSVLLDERMLDIDNEVVVMRNGDEVYRGIPERRLSTMLLTAGRGDPEMVFAAKVLAGK